VLAPPLLLGFLDENIKFFDPESLQELVTLLPDKVHVEVFRFMYRKTFNLVLVQGL